MSRRNFIRIGFIFSDSFISTKFDFGWLTISKWLWSRSSSIWTDLKLQNEFHVDRVEIVKWRWSRPNLFRPGLNSGPRLTSIEFYLDRVWIFHQIQSRLNFIWPCSNFRFNFISTEFNFYQLTVSKWLWSRPNFRTSFICTDQTFSRPRFISTVFYLEELSSLWNDIYLDRVLSGPT